MTLAADLLTDLAVFFNADDFGVAASLTSGGTTRTITVILDAPTRVIDPDTGVTVTVRDYSCQAKSSDVASVIQGDTLVIAGVTYKVAAPPEPDGTGITTIPLRTS